MRDSGYNKNKFKALLIENGYEPPSSFYINAGVSLDKFRKQLSGRSPFNRLELLRIKYLLHLSDEKFCDIFFDTTCIDVKRD